MRARDAVGKRHNVSPLLAGAFALMHARATSAEPTFHALPGGAHVSATETLPAGQANVELMSGAGYRRGLLAEGHRFVRVAGTVSAAFGVTDTLSLAASFDGYYDRHRGFAPGGCGASCEDGYVGAPHLFARVARPRGRLALGAQAEVWVPGDVAPSFKVAATSLDLRAVVAADVGPARLALDLGYRLDNTANGIDDIEALTLADRVSYGVSNYNALVAGARATLPVHSRVDVGLETSLSVFLGTAPDSAAGLESGSWSGRLGLTAAARLAARWTAVAYVEAVKGPGVLSSQVMAATIPLVPYEPMIAGGIGVSTRFGASKPPRALACWETAAGCKPEEEPLLAEVIGTIVDENGQPLAGATVTITGTNPSDVITRTTNADGTYAASVKVGRRLTTQAQGGPKVVDDIDQTTFDVRAELDGREISRVSVTATKPGRVDAQKITLEPALPAGQVKGVVRTQRGEPIAAATVIVAPGDRQGVTSTDGSFAIDLAPGTYMVTVRAPGFQEQHLSVTIAPNGVALAEFVLR